MVSGKALCTLEGNVFVSSGSHIKTTYAGWLKTTEIYCFTVLKARRLKSRYQQGHMPSLTCRENPLLLLASGVCLLATLGFPWLIDVPLQ